MQLCNYYKNIILFCAWHYDIFEVVSVLLTYFFNLLELEFGYICGALSF